MKSTADFSARAFDRANPPLLDKAARAGTLSLREIRALAAENPFLSEDSRGRVALALAFLWHDHWEDAHRIAQSDEGEPAHDLLHGIVHRREGDFSNSGYWFREAGQNGAFEILGRRAAILLIEAAPGMTPEEYTRVREQVLPDGAWSPRGFIGAVRKKEPLPLLRALQAEETIAFFETLTA